MSIIIFVLLYFKRKEIPKIGKNGTKLTLKSFPYIYREAVGESYYNYLTKVMFVVFLSDIEKKCLVQAYCLEHNKFYGVQKSIYNKL